MYYERTKGSTVESSTVTSESKGTWFSVGSEHFSALQNTAQGFQNVSS